MKDTVVTLFVAVLLASMFFYTVIRVEKERTRQIELSTGCKK